MEKYDIKFKTVSKNIITISAENKQEAFEKAKELFNSSFKNAEIRNITKYYYVVDLDDDTVIVQEKEEVE